MAYITDEITRRRVVSGVLQESTLRPWTRLLHQMMPFLIVLNCLPPDLE